MSLSAGQRQRIGLARAVFGDPFLIVLDEPNANLDADGENALCRAIQIMRQNKSIVIVISHRPSALAALNMAMVLFEGKVIAFGSCQEIFARVGASAGRPAPGAQPIANPNANPKVVAQQPIGNVKTVAQQPQPIGNAKTVAQPMANARTVGRVVEGVKA
jgi:ABC-type multidrug transport system ATPase subunit